MLAWLGCLGTVSGAGLEPRLMTGLDVHSEPVPGATAVNGVPFLISRATGRDVPLLFERLVSEWREAADGHPPRLDRNGEWNIASRIHDGHSEVIQWRMARSGAELLWSDTDLRAIVPHASPPRYLPAICQWNAPISGRATGQHFVQSIASCTARPSAVTDHFDDELPQQGWQTRRTPSGLRARRGESALEVVIQPVVVPAERLRNASTIVVVQTNRHQGMPPESGR